MARESIAEQPVRGQDEGGQAGFLFGPDLREGPASSTEEFSQPEPVQSEKEARQSSSTADE